MRLICYSLLSFFPLLIFTQPPHGEYGLEHIPLLTSSHEPEILDVDAQHRYGAPDFYQPPRSIPTQNERVGFLPTQQETPNFFLDEFNKVLEKLTAGEDMADKRNRRAYNLGKQAMKILSRPSMGKARLKYNSNADEMGRDAANSAMSLFGLRIGLLGANYPGEAGINLSLQQLGFSQETIRKIDQFISQELESEQSSTEVASGLVSNKELELIKNIQEVFQKHFATFVKGLPRKGGAEQLKTLDQEMKALHPQLVDLITRVTKSGRD
ncbi:hypothetical protein PCANC_09706 [Puccinia coronata f. sp. avenae]|uniref:Secreted protein n=1 Tax=Puccinia coronata f. sp. avenae TaxID=200324 RepID=A0A2N5V7I7_9BASI|nr:hypothetical protein PCANC_09706 [Puccinia coronata f. sp. avenae]